LRGGKDELYCGAGTNAWLDKEMRDWRREARRLQTGNRLDNYATWIVPKG
jgi:hypothetical protein